MQDRKYRTSDTDSQNNITLRQTIKCRKPMHPSKTNNIRNKTITIRGQHMLDNISLWRYKATSACDNAVYHNFVLCAYKNATFANTTQKVRCVSVVVNTFKLGIAGGDHRTSRPATDKIQAQTFSMQSLIVLATCEDKVKMPLFTQDLACICVQWANVKLQLGARRHRSFTM